MRVFVYNSIKLSQGEGGCYWRGFGGGGCLLLLLFFLFVFWCFFFIFYFVCLIVRVREWGLHLYKKGNKTDLSMRTCQPPGYCSLSWFAPPPRVRRWPVTEPPCQSPGTPDQIHSLVSEEEKIKIHSLCVQNSCALCTFGFLK